MKQTANQSELDFLKGLKFKKLIRGSFTDSYHVGDYFIDRRTIEIVNSVKEAEILLKNCPNALIASVKAGKIYRIFGQNQDNTNRFFQVNTQISMTLNGLTKPISNGVPVAIRCPANNYLEPKKGSN